MSTGTHLESVGNSQYEETCGGSPLMFGSRLFKVMDCIAVETRVLAGVRRCAFLQCCDYSRFGEDFNTT